MNEQSPSMRRGLFGVRRSAVHQMVSDRDVMLRQAEGRVRAAESKVARMEAEMATLQETVSRLRQETEAMRSGGGHVSGEVTSRFVNEELGSILAAAEESANRIVERARASTQEQVAEAERVWREAQTQVSKFAAWRDEVEPALRGAQAKIEEVRARIEEVPDQIREALAPLAESVASLDGNLAEVSFAAGPPELLPSDEAGDATAEDATGEDEGAAEADGISSEEGAGADEEAEDASEGADGLEAEVTEEDEADGADGAGDTAEPAAVER